MCGIAGIFGKADKEPIYKMAQAIQHRGPDYQGVDIVENIALAQARLAILDLRKEGNQPMWDDERTIAIVFNGEIYNYLELKKELGDKYRFKSNSDTEVLIYLYKEHGRNMLNKIDGMFTFALYNINEKELFLAKDRMGKKPLYYTEIDRSFLFASELKSLVAHPSVSRQLNLEAVNQYLTFDYVPTPNTLMANVFKLEAASYMIVKNGKVIKKEKYWHYNFDINTSLSLDESLNKLDTLLNEAVKKRLMADVPLGIFLSGGLDSSTVAYYAQKNSSQKIKTFSIGFEDQSYDESNYALQVANHIDSDHYSEILTPKKAISLIEEIYPKMDEPFADASLIPTYYLSQITRKKVTVALGGDGSDELLAGYPTFISNKFKSLFHGTKSVSIPIVKSLQSLLPISDKNISLDFKISQFLRGFSSNKNHTHQLWLGSFLEDEKKKLFRESTYPKDNSLRLLDPIFEESISDSDLNRMIYYYCLTYLHDDILVKVDRASMLNSLEVRAPFLDTALIEFLNTLPTKYKLKGFTVKFILKKLMEDKIPKDIIKRPKKGFGIPLSKWLRQDLKPLCDELFSEQMINQTGIFNFEYIQQLRSEHDNFKKNNRKLIWNLLILQMNLSENKLSV